MLRFVTLAYRNIAVIVSSLDTYRRGYSVVFWRKGSMGRIDNLVDEVITRIGTRRANGLPLTPAWWEGSFDDIQDFGRSQAEATRDFVRNFNLDRRALLNRACAEFRGMEEEIDFEEVLQEAEAIAAERLRETLITCGMSEENAARVATGLKLTL
jgi:hypothetical protein